jgi:hypothetical protein
LLERYECDCKAHHKAVIFFPYPGRFSDFLALRDKLVLEEPEHVIPICLEKGNLKEKVYKSDELQL